MQRKNPSQASLPNAPIDLTSLLDVIFIFLFVVIIGSAVKTRDAQQAAQSAVDAIQDENDELHHQVASLQSNLATLNTNYDNLANDFFNVSADVSADNDIAAALSGEVIGRRVKIISISCTYDQNSENPQRSLIVKTQDGETLIEQKFDRTNEAQVYQELETELTQFIEKERNDSDSKSERTIIVMSLNAARGQIQRRDSEAIKDIIQRLENTNEDVY